ncbi:MAG: hypothetical protein N2595_06605 [bacterium]|nr:hypothetical protein [bacterium]
MRIIRWPAVALCSLGLLVGFFWIGHSGDEVIRRNLETFGACELNTLFKIGALDLSIYESYLRAGDVEVMDPGQRGRALFTAREVDLRADMKSFFERRAGLKEAHVEGATARVLQTRDGRFVFLSETARTMLRYEPLGVRVRRIMSRATAQMNPLLVGGEIVSRLGGGAARLLTGEVARSREFRLTVGARRPEFYLDLLTVSNGVVELVPWGGGEGLVVHGLHGYCTGISSLPRAHDQPIIFGAFGYVGGGTDAWLAAVGEVDLRGTATNVVVAFAFSNIALRSVMPFARVYTGFFDNLQVEGGRLSARGRVAVQGRKVEPSEVDLHVDELSGRAEGFVGELAWLNALMISNASLAMRVPVDSTPPYVHIDRALKDQKVRTQVERFELRVNVRDLQHDFLRGLQFQRGE